MAKKVGITSVGYPDFEKAVFRYEKRMIDEVKRVVRETAEMIATQAKALAPVDEGNLRRSIDVKYYKGGLSAEITVGAEYGIYLEYGTGIYSSTGKGRKTPWVYWSNKLGRYVYTRGIHPQPFFRPSIEQGARYFEREMNKLG